MAGEEGGFAFFGEVFFGPFEGEDAEIFNGGIGGFLHGVVDVLFSFFAFSFCEEEADAEKCLGEVIIGLHFDDGFKDAGRLFFISNLLRAMNPKPILGAVFLGLRHWAA